MNDQSEATAPESGAADIVPTAESAPTAVPAADDAPRERIRIGSEREKAAEAPAEEHRPKPVTPVTVGAAAPKQGPPVAVPNRREGLSEDQQAELEAAMGGATVDELMSGAAAEAPKELAADAKLRGRVLRVHGESVIIDLGSHLQGFVPLKQFEPKAPAAPKASPSADTPPADAPPADAAASSEADAAAAPSEPQPAAIEPPGGAPSYAPAEGSEMDVVVVRHSAEDGMYELKLPTAAIDVGHWDEVQAGQVVDVTITSANKGGLECKVSGIRGFIPMGQISVYRVENAEEYVGQKLTCVITEANRSRRNLILSHRALMERERVEKRDQLLAELAPGQVREGIVKSLRDFGAFVDLGGVDGMIHVSKLSWERIAHPKDILTEGQKIQVKVEKVDPTTGKIALSYRESAANPWDAAERDYPIGSAVKGTVSKVMDFGAFVRLKPGVEGLIHISELDHKRVGRTSDVVSEGQQVEAKVLSVDRGKQRIALSLKALKAAPAREEAPEREEEAPPERAAPRRTHDNPNLKGGISTPTGGEKFGLKW